MTLSRAVIYCRCSTEEEGQADALLKQVSESEACVREQGWLLADRYVELKSGTTTKGREEYNRLFYDLVTDKFEIIVIKSQDRLMRNVKDWYLFLDRMLSHGKRLFMYIEQKFYTADDALITGIKAILAEEYSRELSKKINNAHKNRQNHGGRAMLTSRTFGFYKQPDGSAVVVEEEAAIIRRIYEYSAAGYGSRRIAKLFRDQGYVKKTGNTLTATCVTRIIRNPLYKGTMVMNKLHYDFETKKRVKVPREQWILREGAVPAIVDEGLWEAANRAMTDRASWLHQDRACQKSDGMGQYDLSGKLICSLCKKPYYRTWRRKSGDKDSRVIEWKCSSYLENGSRGPKGCKGIHLKEDAVFAILEQVSCEYGEFGRKDKDRMVEHTAQLLRKALGPMAVKGERERIEKEEKRLEEQKGILLTKLLDGVVYDRDYKRKHDELEKELTRLRAQKEGLWQRDEGRGDLEQRIDTIKDRLEREGVQKARAARMMADIQKIYVHEWQLEIVLSGEKRLWADYPFGPETARGRYLDRKRIMELLRQRPSLTAGRLADEMGRSRYMVRNRMEELTEGGYIRFQGRGGHGTWEILKELL